MQKRRDANDIVSEQHKLSSSEGATPTSLVNKYPTGIAVVMVVNCAALVVVKLHHICLQKYATGCKTLSLWLFL